MIKQDPIVYIVEDDEVLNRNLSAAFANAKIKTESFTTAEACLDAYKPSQWGCFLVDVRLPSMSGIELQQQLINRGNHIPIIMITAYEDIALAVRAMKYGAKDFLIKPFNNHVLINLIQILLAETESEQNYQHQIIKYIAKLTSKEKMVMHNVLAGKSNKQMASELKLSISTVEQRRARIMRKMQAGTVVDLVKKVTFINAKGISI